jgi:hypothetical protein
MAVLLYCMIEHSRKLEIPPLGVRDAKVESASRDNFACLYSMLELDDDDEPSKEDALRFFEVNKQMLGISTIIPFRFPTLLEDKAALKAFLDVNTPAYESELERLRGLVQIELTYSLSDATAAEDSGTGYLRTKQKLVNSFLHAAAYAEKSAAGKFKEWKNREIKDGIRCYALIEAKQFEEIKDFFNTLPDPESLQVKITGPWPPTEFVQVEPQAESAGA